MRRVIWAVWGVILIAGLGKQAEAQGALQVDPNTFCGDVRPGEPGYHYKVSTSKMNELLVKKVDGSSGSSGARGMVVMMACIGADGVVEKVIPVSGPEQMRRSAIKAGSKWVYKPYLLNGVATPVMTTMMVNLN
jgi:hypothetical protein